MEHIGKEAGILRVYDNGVYRDMTPEEIAAAEK